MVHHYIQRAIKWCAIIYSAPLNGAPSYTARHQMVRPYVVPHSTVTSSSQTGGGLAGRTLPRLSCAMGSGAGRARPVATATVGRPASAVQVSVGGQMRDEDARSVRACVRCRAERLVEHLRNRG